MTIHSIKLIFSLLTSLVVFYTPFNKLNFTLQERQESNNFKSYKNDTSIIKTKVLLDLKHRLKDPIQFTKGLSTISVDTEGKIIGSKNIILTKNKKNQPPTNKNQILKKSTIWGIMKLVKT